MLREGATRRQISQWRFYSLPVMTAAEQAAPYPR